MTRKVKRIRAGARPGRVVTPAKLVEAEELARRGAVERAAIGEKRAGRAAIDVDESIRTLARGSTEDEQLFQEPVGEFVRSDPWRVMRITAEFVDGFDRLADVHRGVTVFGSARVGPDDPMYGSAMETSRLLARAGFAIMTGGGPGIMEAANRGAKIAGGLSIGCNIELPFEQRANPYVDRLVTFRYFFVRKTMFVKYSCAFLIFPGGFGTLDEAFEALTLVQTGKIYRFPIVFFGKKYWRGLVEWLRDRVCAEQKISNADLGLLAMTDEPGEAATIIERAHGCP